MFYRLCNTSDIKTIEIEFQAKFKFPNLYQPQAIIDGKKESSLPIISSENPKLIDFAIWGLLPEDYDDDWDIFQDVTNTLNTYVHDDINNDTFSDALEQRRCLIVVNGFFTSSMYDGKLYPYHVHIENHEPFCIAGLYNKIRDGFLTCSILLTKASKAFSHIPNFSKSKPLIFKKEDYSTWLKQDTSMKELYSLIETHSNYEFLCHPVKKDFYRNRNLYKRILSDDNFSAVMKIAHH